MEFKEKLKKKCETYMSDVRSMKLALSEKVAMDGYDYYSF
jgi:hypothetical protein